MKQELESLRAKARKLLSHHPSEENNDILESFEKLLEEYSIQKIELELQHEELLQANEELDYQNKRLDDLFEYAPVAYFILNYKQEILQLNLEAQKILHLPKSKARSRKLNRFIDPASQDSFYFHWEQITQSNKPASVEVFLTTPQTKARYFLINSMPFRDIRSQQWNVRVSATDISDLKEGELVKESEHRFRMLFKNMINGLLVLKPFYHNGVLKDFHFFRANEAFERIFQLDTTHMEDAPLLYLFPDKGSEIHPLLSNTIAQSQNLKLENFSFRPDLIVNMHSFIPQEGYVALIIENVTEKAWAEREKVKSEELLKTVFGILPVGVTITNKNGMIVDCNKASEELLGLKKEEQLIRNLAGKEWKIIRKDFSLMHPSEFASVRAMRENAIVENVEMGIVKSKEQITWINVSAAPIPLPDMGVAIVYSDITERVQAQEETEEKFKNIIQNSTDAIIIINPKGDIIEWNKGCELIFGMPRKSVIPKKIWNILPRFLINKKEQAVVFTSRVIRHALHTGKSKWFNRINDMEIQDHAGNPKTIQSVAFPVKTASGFLLGVVARDISEAKEAEKILKDAKEKAEEASMAKSQFLANISHEIRTPLNAIMGFTGILKDFPLTDDKFNSYLNGIEKSSKALMGLINDILDLSRIEAGKLTLKPTPLNIFSLVEDVKQIFSLKAEQKGLGLKTRFAPQLPETIVLDEIRLRQVLFNLVGNAVKFTHKGHITIDVDFRKNHPEDPLICLVIKVVDTGPGIAKKDMADIFQPFYQKKPKGVALQEGTGLGLAISKRFVEMMQGDIRVESTLGKGTVFSVTIPQVPLTLQSPTNGAGLKKEKMTDSHHPRTYVHTDPKEMIRMIRDEIHQTLNHTQKAEKFIDKMVLTEYDKIANILGFEEVVSFSEKLKSLALQYQLPHLSLFADRLQESAASFDVVAINELVAHMQLLKE